jgi:hypothetical protein
MAGRAAAVHIPKIGAVAIVGIGRRPGIDLNILLLQNSGGFIGVGGFKLG